MKVMEGKVATVYAVVCDMELEPKKQSLKFCDGDKYSEDDILMKLVDMFDPEKFSIIASYLENIKPDSPEWRTLRVTMKSDNHFKYHAEKLAENWPKKKKYEKDEVFTMYENMLKASDEEGDNGQKFQWLSLRTEAVYPSLSKVWKRLRVEDKEKVIKRLWEGLNRVVKNAKMPKDILEKANMLNGNMMVGLTTAHLSATAVKNIYQWWNLEISGQRCVKNIIDESVGLAGGYGFGIFGASVCAGAGPAAVVVCSATGALIGQLGAHTLSDRLTQAIFNLPRDVALENAYNFLGVKPTASNNIINATFKTLCKKYEAEKSTDNNYYYVQLQVHMTVIKAAKEQQQR